MGLWRWTEANGSQRYLGDKNQQKQDCFGVGEVRKEASEMSPDSIFFFFSDSILRNRMALPLHMESPLLEHPPPL